MSERTFHTITVHPSRLRKERPIIAIAVCLPAIGALGAIALTIHSGIRSFDLALLVSLSMLTVLGIEVGYHRLFSHHAFETAQPIRIALAITGCMALQGPIVYWASNHRRHHSCSDGPDDPHSPYRYGHGKLAALRGWWHAHMGWIFDDKRTFVGRYGRDLMTDPVVRMVDRFYLLWVIIGLVIPALLGGLVEGYVGLLHGFLWGGLSRIFLVQQGTYCINSFCHQFGNRLFDTDDHSKINLWLAIPTLGGSLHNNHHAFPSTATNRFRWWHLDIGGWFIQALAWLGLAWNVKVPTPKMIRAKECNPSVRQS